MVPLFCYGELGRRCRHGGKRMCLTGCAEVFTTPKREMDEDWRREKLDEKLVVEGVWLSSLC